MQRIPSAAAASSRTEGMLSSKCAVHSFCSSGREALHSSGKLAAHLPDASSAASLTCSVQQVRLEGLVTLTNAGTLPCRCQALGSWRRTYQMQQSGAPHVQCIV